VLPETAIFEIVTHLSQISRSQFGKLTVNARVRIACLLHCCLALWLSVSFHQTTSAQDTQPYDTLVVSAPDLTPSLQRWVDYRTSQGHRILVINGQRFSAQNRNVINRTVSQHPQIKNLVLIGDAADWTKPPASLLPTDHVMSEVNFLFGSEPEIATDNTYADLTGDALPELNVGRIIATNAEELDHYVDRVIAYETADGD